MLVHGLRLTSRSLNEDVMLYSVIWYCWLGDRNCIRPVKCCWWWRFDWSFACVIAPVITTTSIILSSSKLQNGDILYQFTRVVLENDRQTSVVLSSKSVFLVLSIVLVLVQLQFWQHFRFSFDVFVTAWRANMDAGITSAGTYIGTYLSKLPMQCNWTSKTDIHEQISATN